MRNILIMFGHVFNYDKYFVLVWYSVVITQKVNGDVVR